MKAGAYYEWVNNSQPGNGDSNGRLVLANWARPAASGNYFADLLTGTLAEYGEQSPNIVRDMAYNIFEVYVQDSWKAKNRLTLDGGLRLSHLGGWYRAQRHRHGRVRSRRCTARRRPGTQFRGLTWTARRLEHPDARASRCRASSGRRASASPTTSSGTGETLLRGGYGLFNFHDAQGPYSAFIDLPYGVTFTNVGATRRCRRCRTSIRTRSRASPAPSSSTDDKQPRTQSWSFTVQQPHCPTR